MFFGSKYVLHLAKIDIGFAHKVGQTIKSMFSLKPVEPEDMKKDVVYAVKCISCEQIYIGETAQHFRDRKAQHQRAVMKQSQSNGIYMHIKRHPRHKIDWNSQVFLG